MKLTNNLFFYPEQGMFDCNTYVFTGSPGIIIDPGNTSFLSGLVGNLKKDGIDPKDIGIIVNTHLHGDHCAANEAFKELSGASIAIHPVQKKNYQLVVVDGARIFGMPPMEFKEDYSLDGNRLSSGETELEMIPAPGHTPDSICFYNRRDRTLVCGDVIFAMNTGRVDLPGGNGEALKKSIEALSELDIEYLLPGHMDIVPGAEKVAQNFDFIRSRVLPWL
ncbi:MAG TPA: MBL fold metallo-hydrolase [Dehalococcoidales bacterium]|nr:MBL fold metallo-hydrolase [Dehalococcoidales bacterium]